jgi:PilZ domain-containing protein
MMDEHRTAPRRRFLKAGRITFGGATFDCTIRNFSENGAALEVGSPVGIPERFTLVIAADNLHLPCRVIWRKETRIGVHFET